MATRKGTDALKRRNEAARQYAVAHAGLVADLAALHYWGDQLQMKRPLPPGDAKVVPLFAMLEGYRENAANDDWGEFAESLGERLPERHIRSTYRGVMSEFGGERPGDPEDARTICNCLARLPVPEVEGLAILTRLVDTIPGAVRGNDRPDRVLPTRIAMVAGRAAEADARRAGGRLFRPAMYAGEREGREQALPGFGTGRGVRISRARRCPWRCTTWAQVAAQRRVELPLLRYGCGSRPCCRSTSSTAGRVTRS